jgi:hypothetical protein
MNIKGKVSAFASAALASLTLSAGAPAQQASNMTFFVTSVGLGRGGDLGRLVGADRHCQQLAEAAGSRNRNWRGYLSTQATGGTAAVNARDRIGRGPWQNAKDVIIAANVNELHGNNKLTKETALNEKGGVINGRGDRPNMHDALTGTQANGTAFSAAEDRTCGNWTKSGTGAAMLGHIDRQGLRDDEASRSWNAAHPSRGCSQPDLVSSGGAGLFYCFASN